MTWRRISLSTGRLWTERRKELAKQGDGYVADCKHAPTYAEAARTASGEPKLLYSLLENVMALAS